MSGGGCVPKLELEPKARLQVFVSGDRIMDFKAWLGR